MSLSRSKDWFSQAEDDYVWAEWSLRGERFAQTCFVCQQIAEKALKALALHRGADVVKSHSVLKIAKALKVNGELERAGRILDTYYISGRYPDAFPEGAPKEFFVSDDAESALRLAKMVLDTVRPLLEKEP